MVQGRGRPTNRPVAEHNEGAGRCQQAVQVDSRTRGADAQRVLDNISALLPEIEQRASRTEELRRIPEETVRDLDEAGFFKLMQPEQWGGYQVDPSSFYEAVRRIATACGSTGWVAGIIGIHNWHLGLFDQQAQEDVWGADPTVRISSSYAPMGMGEVVEGGYKVNGGCSPRVARSPTGHSSVARCSRTAVPSISSATSSRARTTPSRTSGTWWA